MTTTTTTQHLFRTVRVAAFLLLAGGVFFVTALPAQDRSAAEAPSANGVDDDGRLSFTSHKTGTFNGQEIAYTVRVFETILRRGDGAPRASMVTTAYTKDGVTDASSRPITFIYNGGPGSSSCWLHMGVFGPKRVEVPSDGGNAGAPPYPVVDNPLSILDASDLVFIDPIGTGYSRAAEGVSPREFWGVNEDAQSIADFIEVYITENRRWNSPKYLAGESYGTTRSAAVLHALTRSFQRIDINGIILVSAILDFRHNRFETGNDMPYLGYLPTYAATAWYHDKVADKPETVEEHIEAARQFAMGDYARALLMGDRMPAEERASVRARLAQLTGLSETYLDQCNLRPRSGRFMKQLLRDESRTVGRFDSRYLGDDYDDAGDTYDDDPSAYGIAGAYVAAIHQYLRDDLGVHIPDMRYEILSREASGRWNWGNSRSYVNVAPYLGTGMRENSDLRVFVANGIYDLATPFHCVENTIYNNGIDPNRVTMTYYPAGHMMYNHAESREKLAEDVRAFYAAAGE